MASPAKIEQLLPDTLPEDFGGWDSEDSPTAPPDRSGSFQPAAGISAVPKQPAQSAKPQAAVTRKAVLSTNAALPIRSNSAVADGRNPASLKAAAMREADEVLFQSIRSNRASMERQKPTSRKWMTIATVPFGLILVMLLLITLFYRGWLPVSRHTIDTNPVTADTQPATSTLKPSPSTQATSDRQPAAIEVQHTTDTQQATDDKDAVPPQVQSQMMHDQLTARSQIPHDLKRKATDDTQISLNIGAAGLPGQGGNSAIGNIFNQQEQARVNVAPPKTVAVSAGVAGGLLVQRTAPVYPQIAKTAPRLRHGGAESYHFEDRNHRGFARCERTGDADAVCSDAVKTWRYKPYKLNGDPVEIKATINVTFTWAAEDSTAGRLSP